MKAEKNSLNQLNKVPECKNCIFQQGEKAKLLEKVLDSFSEGLVVLDSDGIVIYCNKAIENILGYKIEELIGKELHALFIKNDQLLSKIKKGFEGFGSTGKSSKTHKPVELNIKVKGREKKIQLVIKGAMFQNKWVAIGIFFDISKQRDLEREILTLESKFKTLFEFAGDAIFLINKEGKFVDANSSTVKIFGASSKNDLLGKSPFDLSPQYQPNGLSSKELAMKKLSAAFDGKIQRFEWVHKKLNQEEVLYCDICLSKLELEDGPYVLAIIRDITQRKNLEMELKRTNRLILELAETAPVGIIRFNPKVEIEYINQRAKELLNYWAGGSLEIERVKSLLGKYGLLTLIEETSKFNKAHLKEFAVNNENGKKWFQIIVDPVVPKKDCAVRMILRDITPEKMVELAKEAEQRKSKILLESLPHPAWLISKERKIIAQNKAAELMGTRVGDYCWNSLLKSKFISYETKATIKKTKVIFPGIKCEFCRADDVLEGQQHEEMEIDLEGKTYEIFWIPVDKNLFLHYLIDVTKYKELQNKLMDLSMKDPLTGLYNRRYFSKKFEEEVERTKRFSKTFSIIMLDIDDFKKINDTYGHNVGDEVLINIATTITKRIRKTDVAARWGGEEFIILLPETNLKDAVILAEDIRVSIEKMILPNVEKITASSGVVEYRDGDNLYKLINRVDEQLYKAKKQGKNCVCYQK